MKSALKLCSATLALGVLGTFSSAQAAWIACPGNIADNVTGTSGCQFQNNLAIDQDFTETDPMTVNSDGGLFGFTDWINLNARTNYPDGQQSGSYDLTGIANIGLYSDLLLVFKSGSNTSLVGYTLQSGVLSGDWTTPFENPPFIINESKDVSHLSVYGRNPTTTVPEPGTLALLSVGLLGAAFAARKRRTVDAK